MGTPGNPPEGTRGWNAHHNPSPYNLPVPAHVLAQVAELETAFGDRIAILVSHYDLSVPKEQRHIDPFIAVVPKQLPPPYIMESDFILIFNSWDEPGFTGR